MAAEVDALLFFLLAVSTVMTLGIALAIVFLAFKYRRGSKASRQRSGHGSMLLEVVWIVIPFILSMGMFIWGASVYFRLFDMPADAMEVHVVGKQWMWKVEHAGGQREIDALHVPVNRPIELLMTSEDVIHDFSIPAFRIKHDVLPGRYESLWFRADRPGDYHLYCTQFCGTDHAAMVGKIVVLSGPDYQRWLDASPGSGDPVADGELLFSRYGCGGCHRAGLAGGGGSVRAPSMNGLFGAAVALADGSRVVADDRYIRNAILSPRTQPVAGYDPVMPSFNGVISEQDLLRLVAYIQSLAGQS